ncbi:DUF3598 family protein [Synechococcus sp. RSCCF101]|uniref:DUF3598 family protein n=1 Tax=Synechococcus sp. RSCCF101 TaxID=2511069 RepID=UPI00124492E3|nr:DUF3598 family protein [Synechococcus sp. RSCCF101]QEY31267.1 DUF3598 family protein [Synechococcus sp. RSCCF101]
MGSKWENFLRNLGEWRGSFTTLNGEGEPVSKTASVLTLEANPDRDLVHFRLVRHADDTFDSPVVSDNRQDYRALGRQVVFFSSGCFCKGNEQVAPITPFGAEYGFLTSDRRLRLVQLFDEAGRFDRHVLIREVLAGSDGQERPPLKLEALVGDWQGERERIAADWPEPETQSCSLQVRREGSDGITVVEEEDGQRRCRQGRVTSHGVAFEGERPSAWHLMADGGLSDVPGQVSHRDGFSLSVGWLSEPGVLQRLIRTYNDRGEWLHSSHAVLRRVG